LKAKIDSLTTSHLDRTQQLTQKEEELATRVKELESMKAASKLQDEEIQRLRSVHAEATTEKEKLEHSLATLTQLKNQAVKDLESRTLLADQLQKNVDELTVSLQSCEDARKGDAHVANAKIQAFADELNSANAANTKSTQDLQAARTQLEDVSLKLDTCTADVSNRKRAEAELLSQLSKCKESHESCETLKEELERKSLSCGKENSEFRQMIKELSSQHTSATDSLLKKIAVAEADVHVANERLDTCRGQLAASSSTVEAQGTTIDESKKKINALDDELSRANAKKDFLTAEITSRVKDISKLESLVNDKNSEIQTLMKNLAGEKDAHSDSTRTLTERIKQLKLEIAEHEAERKKLESQNLELNHDYKQALKKIAELSSASDADRDQIAKLKSSNVDYQQKLKNANAELKKSKANMKLIKSKIIKARNLLKALTKQRNQAISLAIKYKTDYVALMKKRAVNREKLKNVRRILGHLRSRIRDLDQKLERAEAVRKNLSSLLREHSSMVSGLTKLLRQRSADHKSDDLDNALVAARETIESLKAQLQKLAKVNNDGDDSNSDGNDSNSDDNDDSSYNQNEDSSESVSSSNSSVEDKGRGRHRSDRVEINIHALQQLATGSS